MSTGRRRPVVRSFAAAAFRCPPAEARSRREHTDPYPSRGNCPKNECWRCGASTPNWPAKSMGQSA
jgi:hypothetical protein